MPPLLKNWPTPPSIMKTATARLTIRLLPCCQREVFQQFVVLRLGCAATYKMSEKSIVAVRDAQ